MSVDPYERNPQRHTPDYAAGARPGRTLLPTRVDSGIGIVLAIALFALAAAYAIGLIRGGL